MSEIKKFEPQIIRGEVVKQLETMQAARYINLPENYKESVLFAVEKMESLQDIEKVPVQYITKAVGKMLRNKLDYLKNHCYFFVQNDKESATGKSLRFDFQYQGLIYVAKNSCTVLDVMPILVHESDIFKVRYQDGALIIENHEPTFEGRIKGGYCVVLFNDGRKLIRYYTFAELEKRRSKSMAKNGKFWEWEREMYEKTLINATLRKLIETAGNVDDDDQQEPETSDRQNTIDVIEQKEPITIKVEAKKIDL